MSGHGFETATRFVAEMFVVTVIEERFIILKKAYGDRGLIQEH